MFWLYWFCALGMFLAVVAEKTPKEGAEWCAALLMGVVWPAVLIAHLFRRMIG